MTLIMVYKVFCLKGAKVRCVSNSQLPLAVLKMETQATGINSDTVLENLI